MVDGDVCQRIQTKRSLEWMLKRHPKDPWFSADNFDVDHQAFTSVKKTLMRLSRLSSYACDVNLWMPVPGSAGKIQVLIRNVNEMSQFWKWGDLLQDVPPEMKTVLETGKRATVATRPGMVSVLAPVYNSLGDVVGLLEVVGRESPDPRENVK
jgi:hypothetical protein